LSFKICAVVLALGINLIKRGVAISFTDMSIEGIGCVISGRHLARIILLSN